MKKILLIIISLTSNYLVAQSLEDLDSYEVKQFYKQIELDDGTLDEDGDETEFIYVKTDPELSEGKYEIELTDGPGDLYKIKNTNLYVVFRGYYGYAGYADECILEISSSYYSDATIYKLD
jgi:hypothetical protein